mgnify:CR=1 FL=1
MPKDNHREDSNILEMPTAGHDPLAPRQLTMAERLALELVQQRIGFAQGQLRALLESMGLDPDKSWRLTPEGTMFPAVNPVIPA